MNDKPVTDAAEMALIEETIEHYFRGMHESSRERLELAMHPLGSVAGYRRDTGALVALGAGQFIDFCLSRAPAAERGERFDMKLVSADITGRVAMVKVEDLYRGQMFTDYLLLLKTDAGWRIHDKPWHAAPAPGMDP